MSRVVNKYTIRPDELQAGDVMQCTLALHITQGPAGKLIYRLYQSEFPNPQLDENGVAQGSRIFPLSEHTIKMLFPTVANADITRDQN